MFRKFFSFFFSKAEVPKETYGKEEKMEAYRSVLLSECQTSPPSFPESGCKK